MKQLSYIFLALLLVGCGFQMRGEWQLPASMNQTTLTGHYTTQLRNELINSFKQASGNLVAGNGTGVTQLRILQDEHGRRDLSVNIAGKVVEFEVYYSVDFDVIGPKGEVILPRQRVYLTRDFLFDEASLISTESTEAQLRNALRKDVVSLMMRRIQAQAQ